MSSATVDRVTELPVFKIPRVTTDEERTYETPEGEKRSVTTILDATEDKTKLEEWREWVGQAEADFIRDFAAFRGTLTHSQIEHFLLTKEEPPYYYASQPYWKSASTFVRMIDAPLLMEFPVWHPDGYAGTPDCLAYLNEWDTQPVLLDWKTADAPAKEFKIYKYGLQLAAYRHAINHVYGSYGIDVDKACLVIALPDELPQIEWFDANALDQLYQHFLGRLQRFIRFR